MSSVPSILADLIIEPFLPPIADGKPDLPAENPTPVADPPDPGWVTSATEVTAPAAPAEAGVREPSDNSYYLAGFSVVVAAVALVVLIKRGAFAAKATRLII